MMAFLAFCWIAVHNVGGFVAWLIFYGFFSGMAVTLPALVLPHISPSFAVYGTRLGVLYGCAGLGFLISTPIATAANSSTGGFLGSQVWTGVSCLVASLLFVGTGLEVRKRRLLYEIGKRRRMRQGGTTGFKRMFAQSRST
jgi:MFS family permease